ncbi:MAG: anti-sigma factor [Phycisphaerales bacterium]|nr:anti-sigma factor [Phycisphaerales bacterium]
MEHVSNRLSAYLDGQLPSDLRAQVETHLAECPDCSRELTALRQTSAVLQQLPLTAPSPVLLERLHASIESAVRRPVIAMERFIGLLSGIAACLALVGCLLLMQPHVTAPIVSTASVISSVPAAPAVWERDAVQLADESLDNTPETAMGQWMIASLSAHNAVAIPGGKSQ